MPELVEILVLLEKQKNNEKESLNQRGERMGSATFPSLKVSIGGGVQYLIKSPQVLSNATISEETVYGVLGSEFLQMYTVGFDLSAGIMVLSDSGVEEIFQDGEFAKLPMYSPFANLWMTEGFRVSQVQVTAFLDTGASRTFINTVVVENLDPDVIEISSTKKGTARTGSSSVLSETYTILVRKISAGLRTWEDKEIIVAGGIFSQLRLAESPAMVLGTDILLSGRMILDYKNGFVYLELNQ